MTVGNLLSVLRSLCETDPPEISWQGIVESEKRADLETLVSLGALVNVGNNDGILCLACDEPHSVCVEYAGDGSYRAYCPDAGYQRVEPETLRRFSIDVNWIANAVASSLGFSCKADPLRDLGAPVIRIGKVRFGKYPCELFVACRLADRDRFEETRTTVAALSGNAPAVILTTTPLHLIPGKAPPRCANVLLEHVLKLGASGPSFNEGPIYAALRGHDASFPSSGIGYVFSSGFRSGVVGDQEYTFTRKQAQVIELLFSARERGIRKLHKTEIQGPLETSQQIGQLFQGNPAYGELIKFDGTGYYWLDL
jgi:hypothetical protein